MKKAVNILIALILLFPIFALSDVVPGAPAPAFQLFDASGHSHKLTDYAGKWVVLEWFNKECPFVKKHYGSNNMQSLQKKYAAKDVIWLTVNSSAEGKQGHQTPDEALTYAESVGSAATALLMDPDGTMGKAYGAKTTPHMFVIDPKGSVAYVGAIDDNDSSSPEVITNSRNYVVSALDAGMVGGTIDPSSTRAYGCGVKYK